MATNKLLNKESLNGVFVEIKRELDNIPQNVTDLEDADEYATKEDAQAMVDEAKVTGATLDYQEDGGSPSATVNFSEGSLGFKLKNMKLRFSDLSPEEVAAITGPQGIPGEGAIWTGSGEEIMTLEQELGTAIGKSMSQRAVTNELVIDGDVINLSKYTELSCWISNTNIVWSEPATSGTIKCVIIPINGGDAFKITAGSQSPFYAFLKSDDHTIGQPPVFAGNLTSYSRVTVNTSKIDVAPSDAEYLYVLTRLSSDDNYKPLELRKMDTAKQRFGNLLTNTLGSSSKKAITTKGVSEAFKDKYERPFYTILKGLNRTDTGEIISNNSFTMFTAKVEAGDAIIISASNSESSMFRYGFIGDKPSIGDTLVYFDNEKAASINFELMAPITGYLCISYPDGAFMDTKVQIYKDKLSDGRYKESFLYYDTVASKYVNHSSGELASSNWSSATDYIDVEGLPYIVYQRIFTTITASTTSGMAFYDANKQYITGQRIAGASSSIHCEPTKIEVPANAKYARFTIVSGFDVKAPKKVEYGANTIRPKLSFESISSVNGEMASGYYEKKIIATTRFVKVNSDFVVTSTVRLRAQFYWYSETFKWLGSVPDTNRITILADTPTQVPIPNNAAYVKMVAIGASYVDFDEIPDVQFTGDFPEKWDIFNTRPLDDGYKKIIARVWVTDPNCCDDDSSEVQDDGQWLVDYGVLAIPPRYSNTGKPTRLIIYCHGAAVNYPDSVTRFNTTDLDPTYWLAEGYAIMDIEGNPFNNEDEHICIPQTMDCYVAAYKWVIEHFNICRDGVFVGGRSMGGYNTFNLIRRECPIPVIAACPNVPSVETFGYARKVMKEFCALHMGFIVPQGFTWSEGSLTSDEKDVLEDNWDKWVKCVPIYNMCVDLPSKEEMMYMWRNGGRADLLSGLHAVVKCPVKLFGCHEDTNCPPNVTSALYYRMLINAGQIAELRLFHCSQGVSDPHHYETLDPALKINYTSRYGEPLTDVPVVYVEMLKFWRRYEQEEL